MIEQYERASEETRKNLNFIQQFLGEKYGGVVLFVVGIFVAYFWGESRGDESGKAFSIDKMKTDSITIKTLTAQVKVATAQQQENDKDIMVLRGRLADCNDQYDEDFFIKLEKEKKRQARLAQIMETEIKPIVKALKDGK